MDYNEILNKSRLEESKETVKLYEEKYYEALTDALSLMDESEQFDTLNRMDEKALFGSLKGQVKKMNKQVNNTLIRLLDLQKTVSADPELRNPNNTGIQGFYRGLQAIIQQCKDVQARLSDPTFVGNYTKIDNNTGLFGGNKGNGLSSKNFNKMMK